MRECFAYGARIGDDNEQAERDRALGAAVRSILASEEFAWAWNHWMEGDGDQAIAESIMDHALYNAIAERLRAESET